MRAYADFWQMLRETRALCGVSPTASLGKINGEWRG